MSKNIDLTMDDSTVTITAEGHEIRLPLDELKRQLKPVFARCQLRETLESTETPADVIDAIIADKSIGQRWINAIENNESILECVRLTAELLAYEFSIQHERNGNIETSMVKAGATDEKE